MIEIGTYRKSNIVSYIVTDLDLSKRILLEECPRVVVSDYENTTLGAFKKFSHEAVERVALAVVDYGKRLCYSGLLSDDCTFLTAFKDETTGELVGYLLWSFGTVWYNDYLYLIEELSTGNIKEGYHGMARNACWYLQEVAKELRECFPKADIAGIVAGVSQPEVKEQVRNTYEKKNKFITLYQFYKEI